MRPLVVVLVLALPLLAPPVAAAPPACDAVTVVTLASAGGVHVAQRSDDTLEAWQEANQVAGLQTSACFTSDGASHAADALVMRRDASEDAAAAVALVRDVLMTCIGNICIL